MFPEIEADLSLAVKDLAERDEPVLGRVLKFDYEKGCHVLTDGRFVECTPVEAVCQYIEHILRTELDKYKVYTVEKDGDFGISYINISARNICLPIILLRSLKGR